MQLVLGGAVPHGADEAVESEAASEAGKAGEAGKASEAGKAGEADGGPRTVLRRIQDDVRADRAPVGGGRDPARDDPRPLLDELDDSIRIHSCHGRARQVEVLRDAILHELQNDPTLELRDVIVMCPDIENFAPLVEATFGAHDESEGVRDPTRQLEIRLADRSLRRTNPMLGVLAEVLELPTARITATQVLDLAGREPVRRRFLFSDDDLTRMEEWVGQARVRWGFDADHRDAFGLGGVGANTWRSGLDRILLGVAMADERERGFHGAVPLDDVDSADIELAGKLTEFVGRLRHGVDALAGTRTLGEWTETLAWISDSLTATTPAEAWQRAQLTALLEELVTHASGGAAPVSPVELSADDVRSLLADRLKGRPTRANFRTGHLTVCTLVPMRSIPHRVVCLLGLDDGSFPRHVERDGDDLTAGEPRVGDRDVRSEDRQLLLDALLAARERLVITYSGHDERSNLPRPPAVPVGELLDVVERTVRTGHGPARDAVVVTHPLQPFDPRNYRPGALRPGGSGESGGSVGSGGSGGSSASSASSASGGPWSFDTVHLDGARAASAPREAPGPFLTSPLPARDGPIELDLLERFVRHPVRVFLRERLGISLYDRTREFDDAIPIDLDGLAKWEIGDRVLQARLGGAHWDACKAAETGRGALPPGALAVPVLDDMEVVIEALVEASHRHGGTLTAGAIDVALALDGVPEVAGTVRGVRGDVIHLVTYQRMQPSLRLAAWVRLLAATAAEPERPLSAVTIGRAEKSSSRLLCMSTIPSLGPDRPSRQRTAESCLHALVGVFLDGMREPLPLYCNTSAAYAAARVAGADDADRAAAHKWESKQREFDLEDRDRHHEFVLGPHVSFHDMVRLSGTPDGDERCDALDPPEKTRFGLYARLVWDDLLARETVSLL
jgi:exodeoxyribonuclease V gamma subunit